jgi:hypothetical protein
MTAEASPATRPTLDQPFGPFVLLEEIGRGGMGVVFKARQAALKRLVAVKLLLPGPGGQDDVRRFHLGAEAAARLDHPNIVPVYEAGEVDGQPYLCMKLVDGQDLTRHRERLLAEPRESARIVATAARAVHHGHEHGVFHRDVKPGNVLLAADGAPYLTDFGLATVPAEGRHTETGVVRGTVAYLPPECLAQPTTASATADVYGLGAVLYELLTGRPPVQTATAAGVLSRPRQGPPLRPRRLRPAVDPALETICLKCLQPAPAERYATAALLADDLDRWAKGEPILARLPRWGFVTRLRPTRRALLRGLAWGGLLAGAGGAAFWNWRVLRAVQGEATYDEDMKRAKAAWEEGNFGLVRRLLDENARRAAFVDYRDENWHSLERGFQSYPQFGGTLMGWGSGWRFLWTSEWEVPRQCYPQPWYGGPLTPQDARWSADGKVIKISFPFDVAPRFLKAASGELIEDAVNWDPDRNIYQHSGTVLPCYPDQQRCMLVSGPDRLVLTLFPKYISLWQFPPPYFPRPIVAPPQADRP